eukprot:368023-Rhodomonas_salina.4
MYRHPSLLGTRVPGYPGMHTRVPGLRLWHCGALQRPCAVPGYPRVPGYGYHRDCGALQRPCPAVPGSTARTPLPGSTASSGTPSTVAVLPGPGVPWWGTEFRS